MVETTRVSAAARNTRSARIKALRRVLPWLSVGLLVICAGQVAWRNLRTDGARTGAPGVTTMTEPRFYGVTRNGRDFEITGSSGERTDAQAVKISNPVIQMTPGGQGARQLKARSGVYDGAAQKLVLTGDVLMVDSAGTELASDAATINTATGEVSGQTGLRVKNTNAEVTSRGYDIRDQGDRVIFKGRVHARLPAR